MVLVPAMYYFLVARAEGRPLASVIAVFCLSALRAATVFPEIFRREFAAAGAV